MEPQQLESPQPLVKSFMAIGPTLHYSHRNVQLFWFLTLVVFCGLCLVWSRLTGTSVTDPFTNLFHAEAWGLGHTGTSVISIFEYPWQILILGLCMGTMVACTMLTAQLLSFSYSIPLILAVLLLAGLPGLAVSLVISCVGVASRPLRFRSRIISFALCLAPQVAYWGVFGAVKDTDPVIWGISFAPWLIAWLVALIEAGIVLGVGHLTRYRPSVLFTTMLVLLAGTCSLFEATIGIDELDYQLYVVRNAPDRVIQFQEHSLTGFIDRTMNDPGVRQYLAGFFYPTDPIELRKTLVREIQLELTYDRWPNWVKLPDELDYQQKRLWLIDRYDRFIRPDRPWWMPEQTSNKSPYCRGFVL